MKEKKPAWDRIPRPIKDIGIKWGIGLLAAGLRFFRWSYGTAYRGIRFAEKKGVSLERELPPFFSNLVTNSRCSETYSRFDISDFLLLTSEPARPSSVRSSIIIPVFNKAELTFQCLRALFREVDLSENELIVVDNASTDQTSALLATFEGHLLAIRNDVNRGFVEACNSGVAAARGEFIVFLNNDTIVQPGWHQALIRTAEADTRVGAVGSMLIYPNGHLQEAGGIVWSDGTAAAYGSREDPRDTRFTFVREVDYCSAASLLMRRELFDRLGGFDVRFAPAYYEDTDICMSVRAAGYKVLFQPASRVIHFEGSTAGTSLVTGFKRFQEINRYKFLEKWREVLAADHFPPDKRNLRAAADRRDGKRIVVYFNEVPKPVEDSASVRLFAILEELARENRVALVYVHRRANDALYENALGDLGIEAVWIVDHRQRLQDEFCEVAIICYPRVGDLVMSEVRRMFPYAKIIYDTVDVHFLRLHREYELTGNTMIARDAARFRRIERTLAARADRVWCVTADDAQALKEAAPDAKIEIVPNIHRVTSRRTPFSDRSGLFFIGSFKHRPNLDAVEHFLDEIFPIVLRELPDVVFRIGGSNMPRELFARSSASVAVLGFVVDAAPLFESSRLFVSPLRFGAGMKGKVGQALSFGLPVITTSVGAEGMGLGEGEEALIADEPAAFAEAVIRVYRDEELWQKLSDSGMRLIEKNYSPAVVGGKIIRSIESLTTASVKQLNSSSNGE